MQLPPSARRWTAANGRKGEGHFQFRNLLGDPGSEGVAVRAWKGVVGRFPRVGVGSLVDGIDQLVDAHAPMLFDDAGLRAVPMAVRDVPRDPHDGLPVTAAPTDHVINRVGVFAGSFGGNPGVNREPTAPAPGSCAVNV
jgi:hypothetical protein